MTKLSMDNLQNTTVDWKHCSSNFKNTISPCKKKKANLEWLRLNGLVTFILNMLADPSRVEVINIWTKPKNKTEVKYFLQTVQFCQAQAWINCIPMSIELGAQNFCDLPIFRAHKCCLAKKKSLDLQIYGWIGKTMKKL